MRQTVTRLLDVGRDVAGAWLVVASEGLEELGCIVRGLQDPPPRPVGMEPPPGWCDGCETVHAADGGLPPGLKEAVFGRARPAAQSSALVAEVTWEPAFAFEVKERSLLALDGPAGQRAMRVTRLLARERPNGYGLPVPGVTFLLVDAETGEPGSLWTPLDEALTVAFEAPDSVPSDLGGSE
jgi:hypothetical protein